VSRAFDDRDVPGARGAAWGIGIVFALVAFLAARDYGLAFDSQYLFPFGDAILRYLGGAGPWPLVPETQPFEVYGSLADLGAALTSAVLHDRLGVANALLGHHAFVVLCAAGLLGVTVRMAAPLIGLGPAVLAALVLATWPRFFAEAVNNASDVPAALAWTVALAGVASALRRGRAAPLVWSALAGGVLGAIRLTNVLFLPCVVALWLVLDGEARRGVVRLWRGSGPARIGGAVLLALGSLWLFRPLAWTAPRQEFWTIFDGIFVPPPWITKGIVDVFYRGEIRRGGPPAYHLVMLAVATPVPVVAAALAGAVTARCRSRTAVALLASWVVVVVGRHVVMGLGNYDGLRHVLDAFPAIAMLAALGATAAVDALGRAFPRRAAAAGALVVTVLVAPGAVAIWRLHPYAVTYYNVLTGGLPGAARRFETDYTGAAYREGIDWAAAHLAADDRLWITRDYDLRLVLLEASYLGRDVRPWLRGVQEPPGEGARLFTMQILRPGPVERSPPGVDITTFPVVHEVRRDGVPLLRVREVPAEVVRQLRAEPRAKPRWGGARPGS
jgi:hypothetical protein